MLSELLSNFPAFAIYFFSAIALLFAFMFLYVRMTPHDEWQLIKEDNTSAAVALAGALLGYCLAIAGAASNSVHVIDFWVWGLVAMVSQALAFNIVRFFLLRELCDRIENDEMSAGIMVAAISVSVGLLNAACMTY